MDHTAGELGGLAEVEQVVDRPGGEGEAVLGAQEVGDGQGGAGQHRVDGVDREGHVGEGVLEGLR